MDIIQQKLIWFLGSSAALILLFKLKLNRAGLNRASLLRFRIGFGLIVAGSFIGMISKIGLATGAHIQNWQIGFLEILGYLGGWTLIILGSIRWSKDLFDQKGNPLITVNAKVLSEKIAASLIKGHHHNQLLSIISQDIKDVFRSQAITLHKTTEDGGLRLVFESGLTLQSKELILEPSENSHLFWKSKNAGSVVISDKDLVYGDGFRLASDDGPLHMIISLPVEFEGSTMGVISLYRTDNVAFNEDEAALLAIVGDALGICLENDNAERKFNLVSRYREMLIMAVKPFEKNESLLSALIKSAKLVHGYIPFSKITLYLHGEGVPEESDFSLSTGGVVSMKSGHFPMTTFAEFATGSHSGADIISTMSGMRLNSEKNSFLFPISESHNPMAHLRIDLPQPAGKASYLPLLGAALGHKISERLLAERVGKARDKTEQWLGSLHYYYEKALAGAKLPGLIKELSSLIVNLAPATFCRVIFVDAGHKEFKTIGLAQSRNLRWPERDSSIIKLPQDALHRKALSGKTPLYFHTRGNGSQKLTDEEREWLLPAGIGHGMIVPLMMGSTQVGLLTVGESRNINRSSLNGDTGLFILSIAALISMVLTLQKEKRTIKQAKEGRKILNLRKKDAITKVPHMDSGLNFKSRINGPLAGILASCEYLQAGGQGAEVDVQRFVDVIQRNALRIHQLASEKPEPHLESTK